MRVNVMRGQMTEECHVKYEVRGGLLLSVMHVFGHVCVAGGVWRVVGKR